MTHFVFWFLPNLIHCYIRQSAIINPRATQPHRNPLTFNFFFRHVLYIGYHEPDLDMPLFVLPVPHFRYMDTADSCRSSLQKVFWNIDTLRQFSKQGRISNFLEFSATQILIPKACKSHLGCFPLATVFGYIIYCQ